MRTMDKVREEIAKIDKDRLHLVEAYLTSKLLDRLHKKAEADDLLVRLNKEELIDGRPIHGHLKALEAGMYAISVSLNEVDKEDAFAFNYAVSEKNKSEILGWATREELGNTDIDDRNGTHDIDPETGENRYSGADMTDAEMFGRTW